MARREEDPVEQYVRLIALALKDGTAHISHTTDPDRPPNHNAEKLGWDETRIWGEGGDLSKWGPKGTRIGWSDDGEEIWLDPNGTYELAHKIAGEQGMGRLDGRMRLHGQMGDRGLLKEKGEDRVTIPKKIGPNHLDVLCVPVESITQENPEWP